MEVVSGLAEAACPVMKKPKIGILSAVEAALARLLGRRTRALVVQDGGKIVGTGHRQEEAAGAVDAVVELPLSVLSIIWLLPRARSSGWNLKKRISWRRLLLTGR